MALGVVEQKGGGGPFTRNDGVQHLRTFAEMLSCYSMMDNEVCFCSQNLTVAQVHSGIDIPFRSRVHSVSRPKSGGSDLIPFQACSVLPPIIVLNASISANTFSIYKKRTIFSMCRYFGSGSSANDVRTFIMILKITLHNIYSCCIHRLSPKQLLPSQIDICQPCESVTRAWTAVPVRTLICLHPRDNCGPSTPSSLG
jgi:hypothetical protein